MVSIHSEVSHCPCHFALVLQSCLVVLQALFQAAWQTAQMDLAPPDILIGHRALRISEQVAQQARIAMQGENTCCPEGAGAPVFRKAPAGLVYQQRRQRAQVVASRD